MDLPFDSPIAWAIAGILVIASLAHGAVGFGFPMLSTPVVAMLTDVRTAVLLTLFPNLAINIISVLRGGNWRQSVARYWPVAVYVLIGTLIGTRVLFALDPEPLKLLLAVMIALFLLQNKIKRLDWTAVKRHPQVSALGFGLFGGFLSGTVNVTVPPLVLYFSALGLESVPMTQILNLCFLVGKSTQAASLVSSGKLGLPVLVQTLPLVAVSCIALVAGIFLQRKIRAETYQVILKKLLWAMAFLLVAQVAWHYR